MRKKSKKIREASGKVEAGKAYPVEEAVDLARELSYTKFDESVDLAVRLGVDPRHADQMIRGSIAMPAGTGRSVRVCVITSGERIQQAEEAGADFVGSDELVAKIAGGWLEFDRVIASPEMMGKLGRIGRVLGPRGLMPNPKLGTVTPEVGKAVREQKAGKVEYRTEKNGIVHVPIGKRSFERERLCQNLDAVMGAIVKARPPAAKGTYVRSMTISTTMGPGIAVDALEAVGRVQG